MTLLRPSRRELVATLPLLIGAAAVPAAMRAGVEEAPFTFFVLGDWGRGGKHGQKEVAALMAGHMAGSPPACIVSTGDNFYTLGVSSVDDPKWQTSFERVYPADIFKAPWRAVPGNHDYGGSIAAQIAYAQRSDRWQMPHFSNPAQPLRLEARPGLVDFFFVDTVAWIGKEDFPFQLFGSAITYEAHREQIGKLTGALAASHAPYKFVFGHHGIHSVGPHGGHPRLRELDDVMRAHRVTAYIHGHDHCLFHVSHRGMPYICSGGGSLLGSAFKGEASGCVYADFCTGGARDDEFPVWHTYIRDNGFVVVRVAATGWTFEFVTLHERPGRRPIPVPSA
jgi:acid phosphatase